MGINKSYLKDKFLSTKGYKRNSPDVNNPYNVIPSNQITMKGVDFPVMGTDNMGYQQMMYPGQDYTFPGDYVTEFPMKNMGNKRFAQAGIEKKKKGLYKPDFRSKSQIANTQGGQREYTSVAPRINPLDIRKGKEVGVQKAIANQPAFNQGYQKTGFDIERSDYYRKQKELKDALKNVDVVTDVMQIGNFIPHPVAQVIGKAGNWLGAATDVTQAGMDFGNENYRDMAMNLGSAGLSGFLGSKGRGYTRDMYNTNPGSMADKIASFGSRSGSYRPLTALPSLKNNSTTQRGLNYNKGILVGLGAETLYDAGAFDNRTRLGLPINIQKPNYQMGGTMSVPGVNGQVVSSGPQPLTSVKKTRGPITKNKKGDVKTMSNQQVKQVLKYSKQKPNKI
jgi:hypothetical protein